MAFKKNAEGRVFFQNIEEDVKTAPQVTTPKATTPASQPAKKRAVVANQSKATPLRTSQSQAGGTGAGAQAQTQFQIIALLKTLNAKLQNTQAERDEMRKQLDRYSNLVTRLEAKANKTHDAYATLSKSVKAKDKEMLEQSRRAEQIAQEAFGELEEARKLILELEEKADFSEKELKRHAVQRQKAEAAIAARQSEFEALQKKLADYSLTNSNLTKRLNRTEEKQETLGLKVDNAVSKQDILDRKIEKTVQERTRMLRKVDRIEEAVMQTRDAMNAKAMVLLTDQNASGGMAVPAALEDVDNDAIQALLRSQAEAAHQAEQNQLLPWWKKPMRVNPLSAASFITIALLGGWLVSEAQKPAMPTTEELRIFSEYEATRQNNIQPAAGVEAEGANIFTDLGQAGLDKAAAVTSQAQDFVAKILNTEDQPAQVTSPQENSQEASAIEITVAPEKMETVAVQETVAAASPVTDPQTQPVAKQAPVNDDIGTLDINDEEAVLRALENDPEGLAKRLNEIEPSAVPPAAKQETVKQTAPEQPAVQSDAGLSVMDGIVSAFVNNPDLYNKADPNLPKAVKPIEDKALAGHPEAQHDLAAIYTAGHGGVQQDYKRAAYWFEKSARGGVANAAYNLGVLYHQGLGLESNLAGAIDWYKAAAGLGHPEAQYNLGIAYIEGVGVAYDPYKATAYFEKAAQNDVIEAAYNLGLVHENGLLGESKPDEALMWYKIAADQGSPEARAALQQLAQNLDIKIEDVNRLADSMKAAKAARANAQ